MSRFRILLREPLTRRWIERGLDRRLANALVENGIHTIKHLRAATDRELMLLRSVGPQGLRQICELVGREMPHRGLRRKLRPGARERAILEERLRRAEALVVEGEEEIRQQRAVVTSFGSEVRGDTLAHELLRIMEQTQAGRVADLEPLRRRRG